MRHSGLYISQCLVHILFHSDSYTLISIQHDATESEENQSLVCTCCRIKTDLPVSLGAAGGDVDEKRESACKGQRLHVCDPEKQFFPTGWVCVCVGWGRLFAR